MRRARETNSENRTIILTALVKYQATESVGHNRTAQGCAPQKKQRAVGCAQRRPTLPRPDAAVPSALEGLTAEFGMGSGVPPPPKSLSTSDGSSDGIGMPFSIRVTRCQPAPGELHSAPSLQNENKTSAD